MNRPPLLPQDVACEPVSVVRETHHVPARLRILRFTDANGAEQTLETTDEHPFWSAAATGFIAAGDLQPGDEVLSPDGVHPQGTTAN